MVNGHNGNRLPPSVRMTHLWPVADKVEALKRQRPARRRFTQDQLEAWCRAVAYSYRAAEWYGSREAMHEAESRGEERMHFSPGWGFTAVFPELGADTPILSYWLQAAFVCYIDGAIEGGVLQEHLETPDYLADCLDFCKEVLAEPPETATAVRRCSDGTVTTVTYHADGRQTWDSVLPDGTHRPHETRWRWDR
jgi:hypothetical protein